jgi:hypothetical protein
MTKEQKIIRAKIGLLELARQLGNVSQACKMMRLCRVLTDRGTEYCGNPEHHEYELYLALEDIDHSRTKTKSPQTTDVIDKCFLAGSELFSSRAWVTARRRAGREAQALPRSLHRRTSVAAPVRTRLGPRGFQPETKRA